MAKNGHALIFVALKRANFTEVEKELNIIIILAISQHKYRQGDSHKLVSEFTISFEQLHL
jgi:hypothetical protein